MKISYLTVVIICVLLLSSCTNIHDESIRHLASNDQMYLTETTVERLFIEADEHQFLYQPSELEGFGIYCHVIEGSWCYFVHEDAIDSSHSEDYTYNSPKLKEISDRDFSRQIVNELHPKFVEHSKDNAVTVKCLKMVESDDLDCDVNRGVVWQELPVLDG